MKLINGSGKEVRFFVNAITEEAGYDNQTGVVVAECDDGSEVSIPQHISGDWDIVVNDDPIPDQYTDEDAALAVKHFIRLVQQHNGDL